MQEQRIMLALDVANAQEAYAMCEKVGDTVAWFKIGLRLFVSEGPTLVRQLQKTHRIFLDLKFHDIPNTVAQAVSSAAKLGVDMVNVHASGGKNMLKAAAKAAQVRPAMQLTAVTVLTSDSAYKNLSDEVIRRALLAQSCGLHGVVCSVHEAAAVKKVCGKSFCVVTPGIRWGQQSTNDQQRISTPAHAINQGADYLVIGRPILHAKNPRAAAIEAAKMMV
ncbi:MAG: orotidine-5'-phosphate decarboxylase [Mariprofundales bacterium]